jgi:hypothetical protein
MAELTPDTERELRARIAELEALVGADHRRSRSWLSEMSGAAPPAATEWIRALEHDLATLPQGAAVLVGPSTLVRRLRCHTWLTRCLDRRPATIARAELEQRSPRQAAATLIREALVERHAIWPTGLDTI